MCIHRDGVHDDVLREVAVESIWRTILAAGTERDRIGWISCTYVWPVSGFVCKKGRFARVRVPDDVGRVDRIVGNLYTVVMIVDISHIAQPLRAIPPARTPSYRLPCSWEGGAAHTGAS